MAQIDLGEVSVDVLFKDIKNVHLSVHPPTGRVSISAPERMNIDAIRVFAISKIDWIKQQRVRFQEQNRETPREYLERESHYLWGKRFLLQIADTSAGRGVEMNHRKMLLRVPRGATQDMKRALVAQFYREQIKAATPAIIAKWAPILDVSVNRFYVRQMKTKWGSSNPSSRAIRLNTELAKKPKHYLEYIVLHEMVHFIERHHGNRFVGLMDSFMPEWRIYRDELNRHPLAHEDWEGARRTPK
jgi:predicted metal-dependent hydrolase